MLTMGLEGQRMIASVDGAGDFGGDVRQVGALEDAAPHGVFLVALHEVGLERQPAGVGIDQRAHPVVGHRQQLGMNFEAGHQVGADAGERLAVRQQARAHHMRRQIGVADAEPRLLAVGRHHRQSVPGLVGQAPTGGRVGPAGQRVHERIEVRADVQAPELEVVSRVADHGKGIGRQGAVQALGQLRPPDSPG